MHDRSEATYVSFSRGAADPEEDEDSCDPEEEEEEDSKSLRRLKQIRDG